MIYLDNSATTPVADDVAARMDEFRHRNFANASSIHQSGQRARVALETAREQIARALGAEMREVVFTSGGTEANNLALKGYAFAVYREHGSWPAIITSRTEHHAVLHPVEFLASIGCPTHYIDTDQHGRIPIDELQRLIGTVAGNAEAEAPRFIVSAMHANNETGVVQPIVDIADIVHSAGGVLHSDAVQSLGKIPFTAEDLGADMLSFSSHKLHGPKGIGALYINREIEIESLIHGGGQERNRRGGTEPVELTVGFGQAVETAMENIEPNQQHMQNLRDQLRRQLEAIEGIRFNTPGGQVLPNILSVTFDDAADLDGEGLIVGMDLRGVAVSNGSACTSGSIQPSHVLAAMGLPPEQAKAAVRFSLSRLTSEDDIQQAAQALREVVEGMRAGGRKG